MDFLLTDDEKKILLQTARLSISEKFSREEISYPEPTARLMNHYGAFVTLHKHGQLRGCIGYIVAAKPLMDIIKEVAKSSAFHDSRFAPVTEGELDDLEIEVSVLSPFRKVNDINEIKVGVHGIMITRGYYSGLLLPQVATEYGWDRETFLTHTCHKAGLPGGAWKNRDSVIEIFSALVFNEKSNSLEDNLDDNSDSDLDEI